MANIVALGELLIDFTPAGLSSSNNILFERNPGGAPANVLAAAAKLGKSAAFIGMVGNDQFGLFLKDALKQSQVNTDGLRFCDAAPTTLAFVHLGENGDRSFSFYRNPGADTQLSESDIDYDLIKNAQIFHFGSLTMTAEPSRSATFAALKYAKAQQTIISYDPNLRPSLWADLNTAKLRIIEGLAYADIVKVSEEELTFITGIEDLEAGAESLYQRGIGVIFVTRGEQGCYYKYPGGRGQIDGYAVDTIDTTGAGDAFLGAMLYQLSGKSLQAIHAMDVKSFEAALRFANAAGALATTKKGAIPAMPAYSAITQLLNE